MTEAGKMLLLIGGVLVLVGAVLWSLGRANLPGGLPGDLKYESPTVRVYFPIVTCLLLSAVMTGVVWLWQWLGRR